MTSAFKWYASSDGEICTIGPCDSREEVIAEAELEELGLRQGENGGPDVLHFHIVEASLDLVDISQHLNIDNVACGLCESIDEEHAFDGDEYPSEDAWTSEQEKDLELHLRAAVAAWQLRHAIEIQPNKFTRERNQEEVTLTVKNS
jgi:hypothetical protein